MTRARALRIALLTLLLLLLASVAWASSSEGVVVDWSVLSSGGASAESSSGAVTLNGSLGQTAIGSSAAAHGDLGAGLWYGMGEETSTVYLPMLISNP
jgi:hypothetical protein